jgi:arginyl-tRNA synthetase
VRERSPPEAVASAAISFFPTDEIRDMNLLALLQRRFEPVLSGMVTNPVKLPDFLAMIKPAKDEKFGDYQADFAMSLAKDLGRKPRDIAQEVVAKLAVDDILEPPEIAGPGFINLRFKTPWLAEQARTAAASEHLGVPVTMAPKTIVIDYPSPNVAKPLHVGHLRSAIIGDALKRILRFLGHRVIADNHLGDWGTQFGMLIYGYRNFLDSAALEADPVREMVRLYTKVRELSRGTETEDGRTIYTPEERAVLEACRLETAKLQAGDQANLALWRQFMPPCMAAILPVYERLDVTWDVAHGESFYNSMMPGVVDDLLRKGIAEESEGAVVIFPEGRPEGVKPVVVRKKDGAFAYMASDLATIQYRVREWNPDVMLYAVGKPQTLHFQQLFDAARRWGYDRVELVHVSFGTVLGSDGLALSTRNGGAAELNDLLDLAAKHGAEKYDQILKDRKERGEDVPELTPNERSTIAERVGIGAVKYADLSQNRLSDYRFVWNKMLATDGNSATYMQYAYTRCQGIFRKGGIEPQSLRNSPIAPTLETSQERALVLQLARFEETLTAAAAEYAPHVLTGYLWDLSKSFSRFNDNCPVLKAESDELRSSRLLLCDLTARTIRQTLELIGIQVMDRM